MVPNEKVPIWSLRAIKNASVYENIYVHVEDGKEFDDIEQWLDREIENPANPALEKVCNGEKMSREDWSHLNDFVMAQFVRTPAFYQYLLRLAKQVSREALDQVAYEVSDLSLDELKTGEKSNNNTITVPISIKDTGLKPDDSHTILEINTVIGKNIWLFFIQYCFLPDSELRKIIHNMKWSIVSSPEGKVWPTCDNPFIIAINNGDGSFQRLIEAEGMINKDRIIVFPLCPSKVLIGTRKRSFTWRINADNDMYEQLKKLIIDNADRYIYSLNEDSEIPLYRRRVENKEQYESVSAEYEGWYENYKKMEGPLLTKHPTIRMTE